MPSPPSTSRLHAALGLLRRAALGCALGWAPAAMAQPVPAATVLWLWDRPQAVEQLPSGVGVAYQHATVRLSGARASIAYRSWPLKLPPGTAAMPVIHVSIDNLARPPLNDTQRGAIEEAMRHAARHSRSDWIQLDFEARLSQRDAYLALLRQLQPLRLGAQGGAGRKLSVTALASWCANNAWLDATLVDEIVPMFFRMGAAGDAILTRLRERRQAEAPMCRGAAGFMFGEDEPALIGLRRRFVFHPASWNARDIELARERLIARPADPHEENHP